MGNLQNTDMGKAAACVMRMTPETWERHANPWSGWSRLATFPFLFVALWSHVWIGWFCLLPTFVLCVWLWLNPRVFAVPQSTKSWMSRVVLGERVWMNRGKIPIPAGHARAAMILNLLSLCGMAISVYGFVVTNFWAAFMGWHFAALCKLWFVDRMVWLFEDMKQHPEYGRWLR